MSLARESHESTRIKMAVSALADEHRAQLLNYLHAAGFELGLLVNFGHYPKLEYERIATAQQIKIKTDFGDLSL